MKVLRHHRDARTLPPNGAVALGNFDGVHLGHRALVHQAQRLAAQHAGPSVVFTFDPHPSRVLQPATAPPMILPLDLRLEALAQLGVDAVVLQPFDAAFAALSAEHFVRQVLVDDLRVRGVVVGFNFAFGHRRQGNPALLHRLGPEHGFVVQEVQEVTVQGQPCSSTRIRELLMSGDVATAAQLLGRPFVLRGVVVKGHQRGRLLGFPTANLHTHVELLPRQGVYRCRVIVQGQAHSPFAGVVNVGVAPTFGGGPVTVEAHLLDTAQDLYGQTLDLQFLDRLRDEQKFPGVEALKAQLHQDVLHARTLFSADPP